MWRDAHFAPCCNRAACSWRKVKCYTTRQSNRADCCGPSGSRRACLTEHDSKFDFRLFAGRALNASCIPNRSHVLMLPVCLVQHVFETVKEAVRMMYGFACSCWRRRGYFYCSGRTALAATIARCLTIFVRALFLTKGRARRERGFG